MVLRLRRCGDGTVFVVVEEGKAVCSRLHLDRGLLLLALLGTSTPIRSHTSRRTKLHLACVNLSWKFVHINLPLRHTRRPIRHIIPTILTDGFFLGRRSSLATASVASVLTSTAGRRAGISSFQGFFHGVHGSILVNLFYSLGSSFFSPCHPLGRPKIQNILHEEAYPSRRDFFSNPLLDRSEVEVEAVVA